VFFGDSITDIWPLAEYFPGKPYINRGISGQTTAQMLVRFRQDVIALQPKAVVILAGTNDIAGNTGPTRIEDIEANFTSLAELAKAIASLSCFPRCFRSIITPRIARPLRPASSGKDCGIESLAKDLLRRQGCIYLDYFSAMVDRSGLLRKELANDGLHPNQAGYKLMAPLAEGAIDKLVP